VLEAFLKLEGKYMLILEDDVEYKSSFFKYIENSFKITPEWDILFLGVNEIVESTETSNPAIRRVTRFWGTHAVVLSRKAVTKICEEFKTSVKDGFALPADWLYSHTIKEHGLVAYCPTEPRTFVQQKEGLVSTCTGNVRKY
jgi:GR25 family glycosyltransferase involved in LPS biosynthesis